MIYKMTLVGNGPPIDDLKMETIEKIPCKSFSKKPLLKQT